LPSEDRKPGFFVTMEGVDGCGKSTQARLLVRRLKAEGHPVLLTREPGGTRLGRTIRSCLLTPGARVGPVAEFLLFAADRAQHVAEVVRPALRRGLIVVSDRFSDSSRAYQGFGRGLGLVPVDRINKEATGGLKPDLTVLLDLPVREGLIRVSRRGAMTRLDREKLRFHEKVRSAFLVLATREPGRIRVVDARLGRQETSEAIFRHVIAGVRRRAK